MTSDNICIPQRSFSPLQLMCQAEDCRTSFEAFGHDLCRFHAACRTVKDDRAIVWDPVECSPCSHLIMTAIKRSSVTPEEKKSAMDMLRAWVKGFQKNRPGTPFLPSEQWRLTLFPRSGKEIVWP